MAALALRELSVLGSAIVAVVPSSSNETHVALDVLSEATHVLAAVSFHLKSAAILREVSSETPELLVLVFGVPGVVFLS